MVGRWGSRETGTVPSCTTRADIFAEVFPVVHEALQRGPSPVARRQEGKTGPSVRDNRGSEAVAKGACVRGRKTGPSVRDNRGRSPMQHSRAYCFPKPARQHARGVHLGTVPVARTCWHKNGKLELLRNSNEGDKLARKAREYSECKIHHAGIKGINSQEIFYDDEDRMRFLQTLFIACENVNLSLSAWTLMNNHVHLLLHGDSKKLAQFFKSIGARYVRWINWKHRRDGQFLNGRYYARPVMTNREFEQVASYIFNNPVRANIVDSPDNYKWSNFNDLILGLDDDAASLINEITSVQEVINKTFRSAKEGIDRKTAASIDIFPKERMTDDAAISMITEVIYGKDICEVVKMTPEQQSVIVNDLLDHGCTANQIARIVGLSRRQIGKLVG